MKAITKTASILLIMVLTASVGPLLLAQSGRGTLTGVIKDSTGALVLKFKSSWFSFPLRIAFASYR